jgi:drug/metabolite transporter (DMT)-like permease
MFIAGYTLVDGAAVRDAGESAPYTAALFMNNTVTIGAVALISRSGPAVRSALTKGAARSILGGLASAAAYLLVLTAARWTPLATVAAVRETSVVLGALAGWLLLGETFGRARVAASIAIAAGVALIVA